MGVEVWAEYGGEEEGRPQVASLSGHIQTPLPLYTGLLPFTSVSNVFG